MEEMHLRYGGVQFINNVSPEEINIYVRELPSEKKDSLFEVIQMLEADGLVSIINGNQSTIDHDMQRYLEPNGGDGQ